TRFSIHGISPLLGLCHELSCESVTYVIAQCVTFLCALYMAIRLYGLAQNPIGQGLALPLRVRYTIPCPTYACHCEPRSGMAICVERVLSVP
ncbi:MAG: hypothetical protein ACYC7M_10235, partial [Bellilinea sp.]